MCFAEGPIQDHHRLSGFNYGDSRRDASPERASSSGGAAVHVVGTVAQLPHVPHLFGVQATFAPHVLPARAALIPRHFCHHSLIRARAQYLNVAISGTPCYRRGGGLRAHFIPLCPLHDGSVAVVVQFASCRPGTRRQTALAAFSLPLGSVQR